MKLTLFDLDHTLLAGDSDVLWCEFLMQRGEIDRASFEPRNRDMEARYQAGTVGSQEFCEFYVSTLAGRSAAQWEPLRRDFLREQVVPRIPTAARELVQQHQAGDDLVVLTTATNRFITELTARHLGIGHLIATECEVADSGAFSGRVAGTPNMREGKVARLHEWLAAQGLDLVRLDSTAYSDSANDLALLLAVRHAVAVSPDARLRAAALDRGWRILDLH